MLELGGKVTYQMDLLKDKTSTYFLHNIQLVPKQYQTIMKDTIETSLKINKVEF